ncbi:MAG TPA: PLP-dependent aminotransferase family protein, partial [Magnetovibrio sp.]
MHWQQKFSVDAEAVKASEIRELLKILADPSILSFAGGIPDPALFPMNEFSAILAELQAQPDLYRQSLQYSATEGYAPLRTWISETFSSPYIALGLNNVLVTNGAQQSLTLLATALISPGDAIAVANPTYLGALQVFGIRRPRYVTIATDDHGLTVDGVEAAFKQGVKFLYTVPDFQNPGGMTLSEDRRRAIVEL